MKKLIIAFVFGIGLTGFAQEATPQPNRTEIKRMTPEQRQQKHLAHLTKELTLDAKQQEAVSKILSDKNIKAQDLKAQKDNRKASGDKMTTEERTAFKNTMLAEKADTEAKMKAVLSSDQYQKWLDMREENKGKMKDKMKERRGEM